MTFQYPLGLLGLIGIPILIIVYIIKSKFTEQTVSATYLWTLSEKFLKKKRKDNKLTGIISLILQILAIAIISLTIAHPVFTLPGAAHEYCFVLDSSGSMNIVSDEGKTRFELGKEKIKEMIEGSADGSYYTLISVGSDTTTVFEREDSKDEALVLLGEAEPGYGSQSFGEALNRAQAYFEENPGVCTYLLTDKAYSSTENLELISLSDSRDNYALSDVEYDYTVLGYLTVKGKAVSYESDATISLKLTVDGADVENGTQEISVSKTEPKDFSFTVYTEKYSEAVVEITNSDSLMLDNKNVLYNVKNENAYKTLLVSQTPFFLKSVMEVVGSADITVMEPSEYTKLEEGKDSKITGYGLYIFHSCNPKAVPTDGSVWLINPTASVENSGFNYQGVIKLDKAETLEKTKASASTVRQLLENVGGNSIYISKYSKLDTYRKFNTLFTHDGNPAIFTGMNTYGNREVVFAFDLHNSDMPLLADYVFLIKNLLDFSFPTVVDDAFYSCGQMAQINVVPNCESIRVDSPSGKISHLSTAQASSELSLDEVGVYTVTVLIGDEQREYHIYSALADAEKDPVTEAEEKIGLYGEAKEGGLDGIYDKLIIFFICLAVIMVADWMVYCYDKYQLR
ncbi:MAG: VWA domain-containing protein [Ruminococcaceae bacterium]|nr:VWA domain-containing protein [Oscillospiraceae bacterium]